MGILDQHIQNGILVEREVLVHAIVESSRFDQENRKISGNRRIIKDSLYFVRSI